MSIETLALVLLIVFIAAVVLATFGFGDALLAMPFLSMVLGVQQATPLMALCGFTLSLAIIGSGFRKIRWGEVGRMVGGSLFGVPVGIWILKNGDESKIKLTVGIIIALVALYNLIRPAVLHLANERLAPVFGFAGGVLGGAFNTSGPPAVIYGTMRQWSPLVFTGMLQAYFIPTGVLAIIGHASSGLLNFDVLNMYLFAFPLLGLAFFVGRKLKSMLNTAKFHSWVFLLILISGILLIINSI